MNEENGLAVTDSNVTPARPGKSRKKRRSERSYSAKGFPKRRIGNHAQNSRFKRCEISLQDVRRSDQRFYQEPDRQVQNAFILKYVTVKTPARKRSRSDSFEKSVTTKCYLPKNMEAEQ
ncbi:hypothetical protein PR048_020404 [Dryococelus australis]|uniref:Uncharacterized protein n=1 Tax=Dryococelus australis TaxID=614101 RepID=A0ABQ9H679_9NEOP|nr:hypothetical protein PR048_020404 [Dryococelus australis]